MFEGRKGKKSTKVCNGEIKRIFLNELLAFYKAIGAIFKPQVLCCKIIHSHTTARCSCNESKGESSSKNKGQRKYIMGGLDVKPLSLSHCLSISPSIYLEKKNFEHLCEMQKRKGFLFFSFLFPIAVNIAKQKRRTFVFVVRKKHTQIQKVKGRKRHSWRRISNKQIQGKF